MQRELSLLVDYGVPGVAAALIPDHDVIRLGHKVDHAAFSLIAPVDAYDRSVGHFERYLFSFIAVTPEGSRGSIPPGQDVHPAVSR